MHTSIRSFVLSITFLILAACSQKLPAPGQIADLDNLPQHVEPYIAHLPPEGFFLPKDTQTGFAAAYEAIYFSPWDSPILSEEENPFAKIQRFEGKRLYGENLLPRPDGWLETMKRKMNKENWPSMEKPAITVGATALRMLPTVSPFFYNPENPGEGFPFDYQQDSLIPAGTPLLVRHVSVDGDWYFVKAPWLSGWVRPQEIAWVDEDFIQNFRSPEKITFIRDEVPLFTEDGAFAIHGRVGMILPCFRTEKTGGKNCLLVGLPLRKASGRAVLGKGLVSKKLAHFWPIPATHKNFQIMADELIGKNYGWGGLYENRDCSALTQDIYASFGLPIPRNSREQAKAGQWISLSGLSAGEKEKHILEKARPLGTLLFMPGHVMLYLGQDPASGKPAVLHSLWGLRTRFSGKTGRWIIGKTVITSLNPGEELPHLARPDGLIVERITGMSQICMH
jgi:hypothetical protein